MKFNEIRKLLWGIFLLVGFIGITLTMLYESALEYNQISIVAYFITFSFGLIGLFIELLLDKINFVKSSKGEGGKK